MIMDSMLTVTADWKMFSKCFFTVSYDFFFFFLVLQCI